jgi:hypothetical protein
MEMILVKSLHRIYFSAPISLGYLCEKFLESPEGVLLLLVGHPAGGAHVKQVQDCGLHLKQNSLYLST